MRRLIGALCAAGMVVLATPHAALADEEKQAPLATRLAAKSHPAVQLILTKYSADLSVPTVGVRQGAFDKALADVARDAVEGRIPRDGLSYAKAVVAKLSKDVDKYFKPIGPDRTVKAETAGLCTGWWVTADGYMVTGAHCVKPDERTISQTFAKQALTDLAKGDAKNVKALLKGISADDELKRESAAMFTTFNARHLKMRNLSQSTAVLQSVKGGGVDKTAKTLPAEVVAAGENYPGKDVAILKVNGQKNLPTLALGDDADVQVGDTLYIDGFPGTVSNSPELSLESKLQPTFTQGPYNAQRTTQSGVPYFQTQAPAYGGNSGGPVFSDSGRVVGILIAGLTDGGSAAQNQQLVLPVSIVKEKLNEKNVKPVQSPTTAAYNEALDLFFKRHYKNALPKFREVQNLDPGHPYVAKYVSDSQAAITAGKDETPPSLGAWLLVVGVIVVGGAAVGAVVLVVRRSRRRRVAPGPMGGFPPPGPMGPGLPPYAAPPAYQGPAYQGPGHVQGPQPTGAPARPGAPAPPWPGAR